MRKYLALRDHEDSDSLNDVVNVLKATPGIAVQWSRDQAVEGNAPYAAVVLFANDSAEERIEEIAKGWLAADIGAVPASPDNDAPFGSVSKSAGFVDQRVKQPPMTAEMEPWLAFSQKNKASLDFNDAAAMLLKQPTVRLVEWHDHSAKDNGVRASFILAARDEQDVQKVIDQMPGWTAVNVNNLRPKP